MDPELVKKLEEALSLSRENNKMLRAMRNAQRRAGFFRLLYWVVIVGMGIASFYFIQPYLNTLSSMTGANNGTSLQDQLKSGNYQEILKQVQEFKKNNQ